MLVPVRASAYCTLAALLLSGPPAVAQTATGPPEPTTFRVFVDSTPVGFERLELVRGDDGWTVRSRGDLAHPINLQNRLFEIEYDEQWRPRSLSIQGVRNDSPFSLLTTFGDTGASTVVEEAGRQTSLDQPTPATAVVLPEYFFAAYEALAARLAGVAIGDDIPVFVPPSGISVARLEATSTSQISTPSSAIEAHVHTLSLGQAGASLPVTVWTDATGRLLRVSIPSARLDVVREDLVSVSARVRQATHAGDEETRIQSEGFSLAATITTPVDHPRPEAGWPTVLLVPSSTSPDRDGTVADTPVLGQVAHALANAGYMTLRYDRRGSGQSGGRTESATLETHAGDARALIRDLDKRDDVDTDRMTVLGHGDGGWIAMIAAREERRIDNLVLIATPAGTGADLVMEQQRAALDEIGASDTVRAENIALQQQIRDAVLYDGPWTGVPDPMRGQADTPWFRSFLEFDVADTLRRTRQRLLIIGGSRDERVGPRHADQLATIALTRHEEATTDSRDLDGLDHRLAEVDSGDPAVSQSFTDALRRWLEMAP